MLLSSFTSNTINTNSNEKFQLQYTQSIITSPHCESPSLLMVSVYCKSLYSDLTQWTDLYRLVRGLLSHGYSSSI